MSPLRGLDLEVLDVGDVAVGLDRGTDARRSRAGPCSPSSAAHRTAGCRRSRRYSLKRSAPSLRRERYSDRRRSSATVQREQVFDVGGGDRRADFLDVAGRQRAAVAVGELQAGFLAVALRPSCFAQFVVPVAHDRRQFGLELGLVDLDLRAGASAARSGATAPAAIRRSARWYRRARRGARA